MPGSGALFLLFTLLIVYLASSSGTIGQYFQMQWQPVLLCMLPVTLCAIVISRPSTRTRLSWHGYGVLILATSTALQFYSWSMVCFSAMPGAILFAAPPILIAAYHGHCFQASLYYILPPLTTLTAVLMAATVSLVWVDTAHALIVVFAGAMALMSAFVTGEVALRSSAGARERDAMRAAIDAQLLLEKATEVASIEDTVQAIRGTNHDAGNALTSILMNLDQISMLVKRHRNGDVPVSGQTLTGIGDIAEDVATSARRLKDIIAQGRDIGRQQQDQEEVDVLGCAQQAIEQARQRYPTSAFKLDVDEKVSTSGRIFRLTGGITTLDRVLTNLLINACQGDGHRAASHVNLRLYYLPQDEGLALRVEDDGPGFAPDVLTQNFRNMVSTKNDGSGLGLYTCERLIQANRGRLSISNLNPGACVEIVFPMSALEETRKAASPKNTSAEALV